MGLRPVWRQAPRYNTSFVESNANMRRVRQHPPGGHWPRHPLRVESASVESNANMRRVKQHSLGHVILHDVNPPLLIQTRNTDTRRVQHRPPGPITGYTFTSSTPGLWAARTAATR
jgi:hypothetical protein